MYPIINTNIFRRGIDWYLGYNAAQLVGELLYMPEYRRIDSSGVHWNFS